MRVSTGDASVATNSLEVVSNKKAFGEDEFCSHALIQRGVQAVENGGTYSAKYVEQILEVRQRPNQLV